MVVSQYGGAESAAACSYVCVTQTKKLANYCEVIQGQVGGQNVPEAAPPSPCPLSRAWQSGWRIRPRFGSRCQRYGWSWLLPPTAGVVGAVGAASSRWNRLESMGLSCRRAERGLCSASRGVGGRRARHRCRTRRRRRRRRGLDPGLSDCEERRMRLWSGMTEEESSARTSGVSWLLRWGKGHPPHLGR